MKQLSVVLPCFNPTGTWQTFIIDFWQRLQQYHSNSELIIVRDGGHTISEADIHLLTENIPHFTWISYEQNRGKGYAIREGIKAAQGDYIIYTDIDFPYTMDSFVQILEALKSEKFDVVVGVKNEAYYSKVPFLRKIVSRMLKQMIRSLIGLKITDTQCGLKGINQPSKALLISGSIDRYLFDLEFIYRAEKQKFRLTTIPIDLREGVVFSAVKWKIIMGEMANFMKIWKQ